MNVYDFKVLNNKGIEVDLSTYKGKLLLIINSATGCGFTPQYKDLEEIYEKYKDKGFEILDFPCNQFKEQAPGTDEEIQAFCTGRFGIKFPLFKKIEVNGENEEPLFHYLKEAQPYSGKGPVMSMLTKLSGTKGTNDIRWNFTKFLVDREGNAIMRFEPTFKMNKLDNIIGEELNK